MTSLVACLSSGKGTWSHVAKLINSENWDSVFLITNDFGKNNFKPDSKTRLITIDESKDITDIITNIHKELENKINDTEVGVNLVSGTGKEHMAIISALLKLGLGLRFVYCNNDKCIEL
ncbi:MAG: hypothetical protein V1859_03480 [archaeon]